MTLKEVEVKQTQTRRLSPRNCTSVAMLPDFANHLGMGEGFRKARRPWDADEGHTGDPAGEVGPRRGGHSPTPSNGLRPVFGRLEWTPMLEGFASAEPGVSVAFDRRALWSRHGRTTEQPLALPPALWSQSLVAVVSWASQAGTGSPPAALGELSAKGGSVLAASLSIVMVKGLRRPGTGWRQRQWS